MTDEKKGPDDSPEVDWDSALSDWESKSFVPEVAKDVITDKPAALSGSAVSRPLYRPPKVPPPRPKAPAPPPAPRPTARPAAPAGPPIEDDDDGSATVISAIPRELLRTAPRAGDPRSTSKGGPPKAPPAAPSRGGGLGQFFARDDRRDSPGGARDDSQSKSTTRARGDLHEDVVTSAQSVPSREDRSGVGPLRRSAALEGALEGPGGRESGRGLGDGEMFDPFGEPRTEQLTIPAESEIADLLEGSADAAKGSPDPDRAPEPRTPSILVPEDRQYDPEEETIIGRTADVISPQAAPESEPAPRSSRRRTAPPPLPDPRDGSSRSLDGPAPERTWEDERPARVWLDDATREALRERATWLEDEARSGADPVERARALLTCSELRATIGDRERAEALATEARDLAPTVALAHRQARALMPVDPVPGARVEALDLEIKMTPAGPARAHSMLLSADAAAADGDDEGAVKRLAQAARIAPTDVRAAVDRAARALARSDASSETTLRFADGPELAPVAAAFRACLRLRTSSPGDSKNLSPNELLMRARQALDRGDLPSAASVVAELARVPELARAALWLASALGAPQKDSRALSAGWLRELVDQGEEEARRPLAARALEMGDAAMVADSVTAPGPLSAAERLVLATLSGGGALGPAGQAQLAATATIPAMEPLASAAAALAWPPEDDPRRNELALSRAKQTVGAPAVRLQVELGRLLGSAASATDIEATLAAIGTEGALPTEPRAIALEMATRAGRFSDVSTTLESWGASREEGEDRALAAMAAAIVAERGRDPARALQAFKAARAADATSEAALRAIASLEPIDLVAEMNALADELGEGTRAAMARLEAVTLGEGVLPEPTQMHLLETAHRAAPSLPIAAFLAERLARRSGDVDEVLRWIRDRRAQSTDTTESALDAVREALLVADRDPALSAERLREAHQGRPGDVALRDLYERMAATPPGDLAPWREGRAADAIGDARKLLFLDAAFEYERNGDEEAALRCAERAAGLDTALGRVARERAELRTGRVARFADELFSEAKNAEQPRRRREAFERLADLDFTARHDPASALLWHRSIFEDQPDYKPSLRYLEQHLVGEGRDEELEPIASAIAVALRGTGSPESGAHAELAARLRMRGAAGIWESTRDIVEIAAAEREPSLWALRMLQSHARTSGDDTTFLAVTRRLVERTSRPLEIATLLVRAAEAATRLGSDDDARALLERATVEDPSDIIAWEHLVEARRKSGDRRRAAEASESVARSSVVPDRQLAAWYDAGCLWQDGAAPDGAPVPAPRDEGDDDRALAALEAAAAIDVAYKDVFDRLSRIYAARKMQPELAELLERRMDCVTDPDERLAIEVQRGRVLFEAGDVAGAREAYESALSQRSDDAQALAALTDLCLAQSDWEVAEQSLIRLARLLPTPAEQRVVYTQLGDLYSHHLVNLPRAEVALKEVLKCAPDDVDTAAKLVEVYKRQNDAVRALELQQDLLQRSQSPDEKRQRMVELSLIHEETAHDNRKAEQTLEGARREFPQDVSILRALAAFYTRHHQTPAVNILLDRAGADARRALTAGRLTPASFEVLATVFELRGQTDAARVSQAMLATLEGRPVELRGAGVEAAFDADLDDLLAPETLTAPLRALLAKTGDALDVVTPVDLAALKATPIAADGPVARLITRAAAAIGLENVSLLSSPKLGPVCIPVGSSPPTIVMGQTLATDERIGAFLALRALKLVRVKASALGRTVPGELGVLVSAWLKCFNPDWQPQGINASALTPAMGRIQARLPRNLAPDVGVMALEVATAIGTRQATLGPAALAWANRVALLALGDPNAALDAIASAGSPGAVGVAGPPRSAPRDPKERAAWVARTPEARDLVAFGVTEAFAEARARLGLDR
jgi:tetratricopeptide (TPR) repeat protein